MTNIDDSNTTPPGYWFGELHGRLRDRMRDELHDLGLGRRGWRILHTLADSPATAEDLAAALPRHDHSERRGGYGTDRRSRHSDRGETDRGTEPGPDRGADRDAASTPASGRREWRGHPDWMRREWERRQEMYRAWMEHDREHPHPDPHDHEGHEHEGHEHEHDVRSEHDHEGHEHEHEHDHDHGPHSGGHGSQQAFERGFERGFVRGFERSTPFGAGRFGPGGFGPGGFAPAGFGPGRFGHGPYGQAYGFGPGYGHGFAPGRGRGYGMGRGGCRDHLRAGVDRILADFVERGWVWFDGETATLTDEGRAAHDAAFERIRALRASVSEGIDPADLATTLATLEAMARNLGWTPAADMAEAETTEAGAPETASTGGAEPDATEPAGDSAEQTPSTDAPDGAARSDDPATD